jgi:hypothetical protein
MEYQVVKCKDHACIYMHQGVRGKERERVRAGREKITSVGGLGETQPGGCISKC